MVSEPRAVHPWLPARHNAPVELLLLSAEDVRAALPMPKAIEAAEAAFAAHVEGRAVTPPRSHLPVAEAGGTTLVMPGYLAGTGLATKIVSVFPGNSARGKAAITGLVVLLDEATGSPTALIDGTFLTAWRTGAAGGVAAKWLSRPDARVAAMLGGGAQAHTQILAMDTVRDLEVIRIWSRTEGRARALAQTLEGQVRARLQVAATAEDALHGADLACTATPATSPLFPEHALEAGAHLTSVGSFQPQMIEVDPNLAGDSAVVVDDRSAALEEAGELIRAVEMGVTRAEDWLLLGDVVLGRAQARAHAQERTWFKSVGLGIQDVTAAGAVLSAAREAGLGRSVRL